MEEPLTPALLAELLALIAHDLRNPLSALRSNVGFVGSVLEAPDDDTREAVSDALVSCDGIAHIVDNMELLIHALSGAPAPGRSPFAVGPLAFDVVERCRAMADSHRVELEIDPGLAQFDECANANRDMFGRALLNLIRNSIQHAAEARVRIAARLRDGACELTVADSGLGLDSRADGTPFSAQGQIASKHSSGGRYSRGLGLLCARIAADAAGATLSASRAEGATGNCFELAAPRA